MGLFWPRVWLDSLFQLLWHQTATVSRDMFLLLVTKLSNRILYKESGEFLHDIKMLVFTCFHQTNRESAFWPDILNIFKCSTKLNTSF